MLWRELFEPFFEVGVKSGFIVIDENASGNVHGVDQCKTLANAAFGDTGLDLWRDMKEFAPVFGFESNASSEVAFWQLLNPQREKIYVLIVEHRHRSECFGESSGAQLWCRHRKIFARLGDHFFSLDIGYLELVFRKCFLLLPRPSG